MKRIKRGYKEFWADLVLIKWKQALGRDVDFAEVYRKEAEFIKEVLCLLPGQKVLDLGCGTGEHCLALARHGVEATGIDIAPGLIEHARMNARDADLAATFLCADMTTYCPETQFDGVFTSSGTFGLYEKDADNRSVLRTICASLADDGRFMIGPSGPDLLDQESFSNKDWFFMKDGCLLRETKWDRSTSLFRESWLFIDEQGTVIEWGGFDDASDGQYSRVYSLEELRAMIAEEGLGFEAAYGSFELPPKPYGGGGRLLLVGQKSAG